MKKIILFTLPLLMVISCTKEYETTTKYIIENNSGHKIDLKVFNANFQIGVNLDSSILILDKHNFSFSYTYKGEENSFLHPFGKTIDSTFVIYDDTLKLKLLEDDDSYKNILNIQDYLGGRVNSSYYEYVFTFSQNDYNDILNH